ncbi:hypothetical protein ATJ93_4581 [Halopiger aswanensis]|uniref:Uncharacterized protein n=1 Tax=Halopiger aswanensis TaxID=148449 RepID=A0A3R7EBP7_9EURY|nr:hypothetical protein ATJ93_4581 [Halopiger aswanensis]
MENTSKAWLKDPAVRHGSRKINAAPVTCVLLASLVSGTQIGDSKGDGRNHEYL